MDEKNKNIRLVRSGGRRVTGTKTEYDWESFNRRMDAEARKKRQSRARSSSMSSDIQSGDAEMLKKQISFQKKQRERRLRMQRRRAAAGLGFTLIIIFIILFLTPLFNIRSISVVGNNIVTEEQFSEVLKPLVGENLLRTGNRRIKKMMKEIPYIETADVKKKLFPPTVKISVTEYVPAALVRASGGTLVVSSALHVLSEDGISPLPVPAVTGVEVESYKTGGTAKLTDDEKSQALIAALTTLEATELTDKIIEISVRDITGITMNYDNRITIQCGTAVDIERKLRLFKEAIMSNSLADNARGTMDLSETGKAVYTP